jgi:hypothetical protein
MSDTGKTQQKAVVAALGLVQSAKGMPACDILKPSSLLALPEEALLKITLKLLVSSQEDIPESPGHRADAQMNTIEAAARRLCCAARRFKVMLKPFRCQMCTCYAQSPHIVSSPRGIEERQDQDKCSRCNLRVCLSCRAVCNINAAAAGSKVCQRCDGSEHIECKLCRVVVECSVCLISVCSPSRYMSPCTRCHRMMCKWCWWNYEEGCPHCDLADWEERMKGEEEYQAYLNHL